jgi:hypothetical protein
VDFSIALAAFGGGILGGSVTALVVELLRKRSQREGYLFELHTRKVDAYGEIAAALQRLSRDETPEVLLPVITRYLTIIDPAVSRWLNLIRFGLGEDYGFEAFLGYLKQISAERAEQLAQFETFWTGMSCRKRIVLALSTDAINAMRRDLHLAEIRNVTEIVFNELDGIERRTSTSTSAEARVGPSLAYAE